MGGIAVRPQKLCRRCNNVALPSHRKVCDTCNATRHKRRHLKLKEQYGGLYWVWAAMRHRCTNPTDKHFDRYGGRGIRVCSAWDRQFSAFYEWAISAGYATGLTIDRIDNNAGYSPDNCRFVPIKTNLRNRELCKFTEETAAIVKRRILDGDSDSNIATDYSCSPHAVRAIRNGHRWSDIAAKESKQ